MQKAVLKLGLHDERTRQKAFKTVSGFSGIESVTINRNDEKLTVIGDIDVVIVVKKLRRICHTNIESVGPAKEPEKKDEPAEKPDQKKSDPLVMSVLPPNCYYYWYPDANTRYMYEDANGCIIC